MFTFLSIILHLFQTLKKEIFRKRSIVSCFSDDSFKNLPRRNANNQVCLLIIFPLSQLSLSYYLTHQANESSSFSYFHDPSNYTTKGGVSDLERRDLVKQAVSSSSASDIIPEEIVAPGNGLEWMSTALGWAALIRSAQIP